MATCLLDTNILSVPEESTEVVGLWLELVVSHEIKGKCVHDAHLLATMKANGVTRLLTFNVADFPAGTGFTILSPAAQPLSDPSPHL